MHRRPMGSDKRRAQARRAGVALQRLVNLVSHRLGLALSAMNDASVTLPQILLMSRVLRLGETSPSELAEALHTSLPAASQMIDRLVQQGFLDRREDPTDRRRKSIAVAPRGRAFLRKFEAARSADYEQGLLALAPESLAQLLAVLERAANELDVAASHPRPDSGAGDGP